MSLNRTSFFGYALVLVGVLLGAFGWIHAGLILVALGVAGVSISSNPMSRVERYLPLVLAFGLFALAIALPQGR